MKRIAFVFLISILIPALLLAALAIRSVRDQEVVINSQRGLVHQSTCDNIAADINLFLDDVRVFYGNTVDSLVREQGVGLIDNFNQVITENWSQATVGAAVSDQGVVASPSLKDGSRAAAFLENHAAFFGNSREVEVYQAPQVMNQQQKVIEDKEQIKGNESGKVSSSSLESSFEGIIQTSSAKLEERRAKVSSSPKKASEAVTPGAAAPGAAVPQAAAAPSSADLEDAAQGDVAARAIEPEAEKQGVLSSKWKVTVAQNKLRDFRFGKQEESMPEESTLEKGGTELAVGRSSEAEIAQSPAPSLALKKASGEAQIRNVAPDQFDQGAGGNFGFGAGDNASRLNSEAVNYNDLTREENEGAVSRLIDGNLHVLLWKRSPDLPGYTFWTELDLNMIENELGGLFQPDQLPGTEEIVFSLLDSDGEPVAVTESGFAADWSRPYVAAEVGQILPRWEVAAYLLNPSLMSESAKTVRLTLWLIILVLLGAVGVGCLLILKSVNYEMRLATQKTDFVSNVSHELKTPLTSIRMFSELLAGSKEHDASQTRKYSEVISKESARLTRLINRLLDFSRLDRGEMKLENAPVDLGSLATETVETYRPGIEAEDLEIVVQAEPGIEVTGDRDALSQVILNLLSNAEKYAAAGGRIEVAVGMQNPDSVLLAVRDRGPGIPKGHRRSIFEKFYRVDDSIDSGIEGSGIGLALCRQIVEKHGGEICYRKREEGGSSFEVTLPVQ